MSKRIDEKSAGARSRWRKLPALVLTGAAVVAAPALASSGESGQSAERAGDGVPALVRDGDSRGEARRECRRERRNRPHDFREDHGNMRQCIADELAGGDDRRL